MRSRFRARSGCAALALLLIATGCSVEVADVYRPVVADTAAVPGPSAGAQTSAGLSAAPPGTIDDGAASEVPATSTEPEPEPEHNHEPDADPAPATDRTDDNTAEALPQDLAFAVEGGFSSWSAPVDDPIQLIKRSEGYRLESVVAVGERLAAAEVVLRPRCTTVPWPAMLGSHSGRATHNPATNVTYFLHPDAESAAAYAAAVPDVAAACESDTPASAATFEPVDPASFEVDPDNFRAWDVRNGDEGYRIVTTHHGAVSVLYTAAHRPVVDADEYRSMLQRIRQTTLMFNGPRFEVPDNDLWPDDTAAEDWFIAELQTLPHLMAPDEIACMVEELSVMKRQRGVLPPGAVVAEIGRWCAPAAFAKSGMTWRRELANPIEDPAKRECFMRVRIEFATHGTFDEYLRRVVDRPEMDPYGPERADLDARLLAECDVDYADGVIGGLDPREPLDQSPQRAVFCDAYRARPPTPGYGIPETPEEWVERYSFLLQAEADIVAPDSIADLWARRQRRHQGMRDLYATGKGEVELYSDVGYMTLDAEVDFAMLDHDFGEYLRINC